MNRHSNVEPRYWITVMSNCSATPLTVLLNRACSSPRPSGVARKNTKTLSLRQRRHVRWTCTWEGLNTGTCVEDDT